MDSRVLIGMLLFERCVEGAWSDIGLFIFWNMILLGFYSLFWMMIDIFIIGTPITTYLQEGVEIYQNVIEWKKEKMNILGWKSEEFKIKEMRLYSGDGENKVIKTHFETISQPILTVLYEQTFKRKIWNHQNPSDIRLRIIYTFKGKEYIFYYPFQSPISSTNLTLKFPFITNETITNYRKDIIKPFYHKDTGKYSLYSLFMMDCHDIQQICLNGNLISLNSYFEKISGPYHDYGLLMHSPVRLKWILEENEIDGELHVTFLNEYLDEDTMELKKQDWKSNDSNSYFITDYMKEVMKKKNQEYGREFRFYEK